MNLHFVIGKGNGTFESNRAKPAVKIPNNFVLSGRTILQYDYGDSITLKNIQNYSNEIKVYLLNEHWDNSNEEVLDIIEGYSKEYYNIEYFLSEDPSERLNMIIELLIQLHQLECPIQVSFKSRFNSDAYNNYELRIRLS